MPVIGWTELLIIMVLPALLVAVLLAVGQLRNTGGSNELDDHKADVIREKFDYADSFECFHCGQTVRVGEKTCGHCGGELDWVYDTGGAGLEPE
ncbi:MAG: hypothetical protein ACYC5A_09950 [Thermoleophilia bacterium]